MSLFSLLETLEPLRGMTATWIVLIAAFFAVAIWDVRLALPALGVHYLAAGLLFVDGRLHPRLAVVYVLVGLVATAILLVTAAQVNWGRPPADLTDEERAEAQAGTSATDWPVPPDRAHDCPGGVCCGGAGRVVVVGALGQYFRESGAGLSRYGYLRSDWAGIGGAGHLTRPPSLRHRDHAAAYRLRIE